MLTMKTVAAFRKISFTLENKEPDMANLYKKTIYVTDPQTGKRVKTLSKKWHARYIDADGIQRRVALAADKKVAQKMLADLIEKPNEALRTIRSPPPRKNRSTNILTNSNNI